MTSADLAREEQNTGCIYVPTVNGGWEIELGFRDVFRVRRKATKSGDIYEFKG